MAAIANTIGTVEHDSELLRRTALGDHRSLKELHTRYSGVLLATAFRVLNNVKDAEEVVQEAFVQIWEKAGVYDVARGQAPHLGDDSDAQQSDRSPSTRSTP